MPETTEIRKIDLFKSFFTSEKTAGLILIFCCLASLLIANGDKGSEYMAFWHRKIDLSFMSVSLNYDLVHWINDGLMTIFFLLVGLEIERQLYKGELSQVKNAVLPMIAAIGGMVVPTLIYFLFTWGDPTASGFGIPMATDIAFALGILSLAGNRVPLSLKIFLTALAIVDDLGAITVIALFYSKGVVLTNLILSLALFVILFMAGKLRIHNLLFYLVGGIVMWYLMLKSGIHPSISGVLLAFAIPFHQKDEKNPSYKLQHILHYPVALLVLPIFALANTAIRFPPGIWDSFTMNFSLGILFGLLAGKFIGIWLFTYLGVKLKIGLLPEEVRMRHIAGIALLGGIGFTMSIFIANLAFSDPSIINTSKVSVLFASAIAAVAGLGVVMTIKRKVNSEANSEKRIVKS